MPEKLIKIVRAEVTRPANTTLYTALDAIADSASAPTIITFSGAAEKAGRGGKIIGAHIGTDQTANVEVFKLHLFNTAPTPINDNAAMTAPLYADIDIYIGSITFPAAADENATGAAFAQSTTPGLNFITDAAANDIYGMLEGTLGFTPASGQKFYMTLFIEQD